MFDKHNYFPIFFLEVINILLRATFYLYFRKRSFNKQKEIGFYYQEYFNRLDQILLGIRHQEGNSLKLKRTFTKKIEDLYANIKYPDSPTNIEIVYLALFAIKNKNVRGFDKSPVRLIPLDLLDHSVSTKYQEEWELFNQMVLKKL